MIDKYGAAKEADNKTGPPRGCKAKNSQYNGRQQFVPVKPHELGKTCQIRNLDQVCLVMLAGEDPPDMAVEEAFVTR